VRDAARVIGDAELFKKMEEAQSLIRRDIVFAASLVGQIVFIRNELTSSIYSSTSTFRHMPIMQEPIEVLLSPLPRWAIQTIAIRPRPAEFCPRPARLDF
jgi:hypothetical protein